MKKVFILDTNILLADPKSIFKFMDNDVVIPISVIEEIDRFKSDHTGTGRNAREVSRILDKLRQKGKLPEGIVLFDDMADSGRLFVHLGNNMDILPDLLEDNTDNHTLAIGLTLQQQLAGKRDVYIVTKDSNLRIKADAFGIPAQDFEADKLRVSHHYTGSKTITLPSAQFKTYFNERIISLDSIDVLEEEKDGEVFPNHFVVFKDAADPSQVLYGKYDGYQKTINMFETRADGIWGIYPRNLQQIFALDVLLDDNIKLVTLSGAAGTGKTLVAIASGIYKTTDEDAYQKLLVARPVFPMGRDIGFLPGDLDEKLNPWMQPIYDNLELLLSGGNISRQKRMTKNYQELISQGLLAVEPLTYIRGRSLPQQYFVVDEAQNLTPHEVKTILTRAGEGTKIVLTGDPYQIDHPYLDLENNGLTYVIERFKSSHISAHVTFTQGERSELATLASELL